jgi:hypothetical protein
MIKKALDIMLSLGFIILGLLLFFKEPIIVKETNTDLIAKKLDSIKAEEQKLFHKIDSLSVIRTRLVTKYETTTLYYDTIRIRIDSMPDTDALYFLLSKSRQLTSKGIE